MHALASSLHPLHQGLTDDMLRDFQAAITRIIEANAE